MTYTVKQLIEELTALKQPDARVRIVGESVCDHEDHGSGYATVEVEMDVMTVRSTHPGWVTVEGVCR